MNILVCAKQPIGNYSEHMLYPVDFSSIITAIEIKKKYGGNVTALTLGPEKSKDILKDALALGVDKAVLICDNVDAGSDTLATSRILSKAIEYLGGFDLIICGEKSTDGETGQVPIELASLLKISINCSVTKIKEVNNNSIEIIKKIDNGYAEMQQYIPGIMTVNSNIVEMYRPGLQGLLNIREKGIDILTNNELKIESNKCGIKGSATCVKDLKKIKLDSNCTFFNKDAVSEIVKIIAEKS